MKFTTFMLMFTCILTSLVLADAPTLLPFQGRLTDQTGTPVADGTKLVRFEIYSTQTGGASPLWTEQHTVSINGGLVNLLMGTQNSLESIDFDQQLYLQIQVDVAEPIGTITPADPPMLPRQVILPSILAKKSVLSIDSQDSELLDGLDSTKFIRNDQSSILNGSLTVSGDLTVNGGEITTSNNAGTLKIMGGAGQGGQIDLGGGTTDGSIKLRTGIGAGEKPVRLTLLNNGNVGIGTINPLSLLHLSSASGGNQLELTDASAGANLKNWIIGSETGALRFVKVDDAHTGSNEFMRITNDGNVGIGTTTPALPLDVVGGAYVRGPLFVSDGGSISPASSGAILTIFGGGLHQGGQIDLCGGGNAGHIYFRSGVDPGEQPVRMLIRSNGRVGIGTENPVHLLHLNGGAYCDGNGDWMTGSDRAYKKDIQDLTDYGLKEVLSLHPVTYVHKDDKENKTQLGFIAQEVKPIVPEVVDGEEPQLGLAYDRLIPVLVNAIKEQQAQIEALKTEIEALKTK